MTDATLYIELAAIAAVGVVLTVATARARAAAIPALFMLILVGAAGIGASALVGGPKASPTETARPKVAEVLWNAASKRQGRIYMLLAWEGRPEPGYYWLPWDAKTEKAMSKARTEATVRGRQMLVRNPFDHGAQPSEEGEGGPQGSGKGRGKGNGTGAGMDTGDNAGADEAFYVAPPPPLPEKDHAEANESTER